MDKKSDRRLVSFRLPDDLMQDLRDKADTDGISVTELVCRLLRQGLQANTDDRITTLEAEIRELRQSKQVSLSGIAPTPVYTVLSQGLVAHDNNIELRERIDRLETLIEKVVARQDHSDRLETLMEKMIALSKSEALAGSYLEGGEPNNLDKSTNQSSYPRNKPSANHPESVPDEGFKRRRCDE